MIGEKDTRDFSESLVNAKINPGDTSEGLHFTADAKRTSLTSLFDDAARRRDDDWTKIGDLTKFDPTDGARVDPNGRDPNWCAEVPVQIATGSVLIQKEAEKKTYSQVGEEISWLLTATVNGEGITGFSIVDEVPAELIYSGYEIVKKPDGAKVELAAIANADKHPRTETGTVTFTVHGKFNSGDVVQIKLVTKVAKLPDPLREITNVVCIDKGTDREVCDEAVVTPKIGKVEIQKEAATKYYTKTGDKVDWKLTATVKGEGVTKFIIVDEVPAELIVGNPSFEVVTPPTTPKATVTLLSHEELVALAQQDAKLIGGKVMNARESRTQTGHIAWVVSGDFQEGDVVELKLFTQVDQLPNPLKEIKNLACVAGICDEAVVTPQT